ncbi:MAG: ABC transporter ATP-binding protein [Magnetococcales bacterium]|nr:ABC transporter ATP-binding protein [Magnetococcales bacterium]NGZ27026.1 ABC transporter ATP-binding protein [Magnetococcales bacterium]
MTSQPVLQIAHLWKRYGLPPWPWQKTTPTYALEDISFELYPGETLGIIGVNGSGKSTLLKVIAGITAITQGEVKLLKPLFSMIELNAGIHGDLTGRENVRLLGAIMGLSRRDLLQVMPHIEAFCELGEWFDRPVRQYSSGMLVRLGFAVSIHVAAEILLMDEVLAVGDIGFQNKCLTQLENHRRQMGSILFVSHNMQRVRRICDRVLLLHHGKQVFLGPTEEAIHAYDGLLRQRGHHANTWANLPGIVLQEIQFYQDGETLCTPLQQGENLTLIFILTLETPLQQCNIQVALENGDALSVVWESMELDALPAGIHTFRVEWHNLLLKSGHYHVRLGINIGQFSSKGFRVNNAIGLEVTGNPHAMGLYQPLSSFTCQSQPLA